MASTACADSVDRSASVYCVFLHTALCAIQTESSNVLHILSFYAEVCLFLCVCVCVCVCTRMRMLLVSYSQQKEFSDKLDTEAIPCHQYRHL
jgi:hypothetical protein